MKAHSDAGPAEGHDAAGGSTGSGPAANGADGAVLMSQGKAANNTT